MMGCFSCCIFLCESIPCDAHRKFGCHVILSLQSIVSHKKSEADALKRFPVEKKLSVRWPFPWQLLKYQNAFAGVAPLLLKYIPIYWDIGAAAMNSISTQAIHLFTLLISFFEANTWIKLLMVYLCILHCSLKCGASSSVLGFDTSLFFVGFVTARSACPFDRFT